MIDDIINRAKNAVDEFELQIELMLADKEELKQNDIDRLREVVKKLLRKLRWNQ